MTLQPSISRHATVLTTATVLVAALAAAARAQAPIIRESDQARARQGWSVSAAGDVNGDTYWDVIVGAPNWTNGHEREGAVFLYLGTASGLASSPAWSYEGNQTEASLGAAVASAGDVNNDGKADVIVGAPNWDNGQTDEGRALVFLGTSGGLQGSPVWTAEGNQAEAHFGAAVASSTPKGYTTPTHARRLQGSFNGDSYSDVVVGAPEHDNGQTNEGRVTMYLGGAAGPAASPTWTAELNQAHARFGASVSTAGKTNNDAYLDLIAGAMYWNASGSGSSVLNRGRAVIYRGTSTGLAATPAWSKEGDAGDAFFGGRVGAAGDVNNDGYWDVIVGAWAYGLPPDGTGSMSRGKTYCYHGASGGTSTTASWTVTSAQANSEFGYGAASCGHWNGDSYMDVVVGAPFRSPGVTQAGQVQVYLGGKRGLSTTASFTADSAQVDGMLGFAVGPAGDVNRDGKWDFVTGAVGYSGGQDAEGALHVYLGR